MYQCTPSPLITQPTRPTNPPSFSFKTNHKFTSNTSLLRAVHRATIEVYTATLNNHPFTTLYTGPESLTETVSISISPSSAATFSYPPSTEAAILSLLSFDTTDPANNHVYTEDELFPPDSPLPEWVEHTAWTALPLNEEGVRFEVVRRVLQLTGVKVPDAEATKMKTVAQMCMISSLSLSTGTAADGV